MATSSDVRAGKAFVETYVNNSKLFRGLAAAQRRFKAFGDSVSMIGRQMMATSAAAAAPFALATRTFVGFEDQMKAVQAVTGATGDQFQRLYDLAKKLGRTTSFTAGQVGGAELNLGRAGFSPQEIESSIESVLSLARATGTELPQAAEIAAGTLRAFNLEAGEMGRVADVMVATANNSAQTLEELGESMKYAAPVAQEFGMSLEQTSKALGVMANMQIKGSMAGTSLRMIMLQASDPKIAKRIADVAGQEALAALQAGRLGDAMRMIGEAMGKMSSMERIAFGKELFGARAVSGALKLARSDFPALSAAIDNAAGTAKKTADVMDSGLGGAFRRLWSAVEGAGIAIGEALGDTLSNVASSITVLLGPLTKWLEQNKELVVTAMQIVAAVGAAGATFFVLGKALAIVSLALNPIALGLAAISAAAIYLNGGFSGLAETTKKYVNTANEALAKGDQQRESANKLFSELKTLSEQHSLTADQQKRAKDIIAELTAAYGDLGVSLDSATGKLTGMATAQDNLNAAMRKNAIADVKSALDQAREELDRNRERQKEIMDPTRSRASAMWGTIVGGETGEYADLVEENNKLNRLISSLNRRLQALKDGNANAATGASGSAGAGGGASVLGMTSKQASEKEEEWIEELYRLQLQGMEDEHKKKLALIDAEYSYRIRKAQEAGQDATKLEEMWEEEKYQAEKKHERELAEEKKRRLEEIATQEADLAYQTEQARIEATMEGATKRRALLELQQKREREEAIKAGLDPKLLEAKHGYEKQVSDQMGALQNALGPRGTFSASAVSGMGTGSSSPAERAIDNMRKALGEKLDVLKKINERLQVMNQEMQP